MTVVVDKRGVEFVHVETLERTGKTAEEESYLIELIVPVGTQVAVSFSQAKKVERQDG